MIHLANYFQNDFLNDFIVSGKRSEYKFLLLETWNNNLLLSDYIKFILIMKKSETVIVCAIT